MLSCLACLMLYHHVGGAVEQLSQKCTRAAQARNWQNKIRPICLTSANPTQRSSTGKSLVPSNQSCCRRLVSDLLNQIIWSLFYCKTDEIREELGRPDTLQDPFTQLVDRISECNETNLKNIHLKRTASDSLYECKNNQGFLASCHR